MNASSKSYTDSLHVPISEKTKLVMGEHGIEVVKAEPKKEDFPPWQFAICLAIGFSMLLAPWIYRLFH